MSLKRALVVDDSKSARIALQKLLQAYDLQVDLADSGEAALDFLKRDTVDVIFMDHTMPGMDGLEAVTAIKSNPATATIPVMMYTTKEGEVYVGQARALGAMGVLPKNVQPHQLFEMLLNLGLVKERREVAATPGPGATPAAVSDNEPEVSDPPTTAPAYKQHSQASDSDEIDRRLEQQALGMSVQSVVQRILEDQHLTLRADILRSQSAFAKEVAHEVLKAQVIENETVVDPIVEVPEPPAPVANKRGGWAAVAVAAIIVGGFLTWQFKSERDAALAHIVSLEQARASLQAQQRGDVMQAVSSAQQSTAAVRQAGLEGLTWALNQNTTSAMGAPAFSAQLAEQVRGALPHLQDIGFAGDLQLTSHLGRFCLTVSDQGGYQLAPDDLPVFECDYLGHIWEDSTFVSDRLSVEFSQLLSDHGTAAPSIQLVAQGLEDSQPLVPYPDAAAASAGAWNAVARLNNRVSVTLHVADNVSQN